MDGGGAAETSCQKPYGFFVSKWVRLIIALKDEFHATVKINGENQCNKWPEVKNIGNFFLIFE